MIRFGTASRDGGEARVYALVDDDRAVDLAAALGNDGGDFVAFLAAGEEVWREAARLAQSDGAAAVPAAELRWLAPIPRPPKILCTFANNPEIDLVPLAEQSRWPRPVFFLKAPTSVIGVGEPVVIPEGIGLVQPEAELGVVVGKRMKRVSREDALDHVFGYTLLNDITAAGLSWDDAVTLGIPEAKEAEQFPMRPMARYKGLDTFGPLGPYVLPGWEAPDPGELVLSTRLGDDVIQRGRVGDLRFSVGEVLEEASRWLTLEPGDVVSMGTVKQAPGWPLRTDMTVPGGVIEVSCEQIGRLANPIEVEGSNVHSEEEQ